MINEVMAKAVTGIDDKLILDAEAKIRKKPSFRPIYGVCALAACLVLVFTFIFSAPKLLQSLSFLWITLLSEAHLSI